jgi:predicted HTH domain antitoxin
MKTLVIPFPDDLPELLRMSDEEFQREAKLLLAMKLYEIGKISFGTAAELAGVDRAVFLASLSQYGISAINLRDEEIQREIAVLEQEALRESGE